MRTCTGCKQFLPRTAFHCSKSNDFGRYGMCKKCACSRAMDYYKAHREEVRQRRYGDKARNQQRWKERYARDKERILRSHKERNATEEGKKASRVRLLRQYGLTESDFELMLANQNSLCALCHNPQIKGRPLYVDHHHGSRIVRGLLCLRCNQALEREDKFPGWLQRAIWYVEDVRERVA